MEINSETIPAWAVVLSMITTGIVWLITSGRKIRLDFKIFALTFILQGILFGIFFQLLNVDIAFGTFAVRLIIIMICFSQSIPLAVSYVRSFNRGH